jgi:hypothetical protein
MATATFGVAACETAASDDREVSALAEAQPLDLSTLNTCGPLGGEFSEVLSRQILEGWHLP